MTLLALPTRGAELLRFPFNEGTGNTVTDTASGLVGILGTAQNPDNDYVQLIAASPSGAPGDGCMTNSGTGFLVVDDSNNPILNITNGPITLESWIYIDLFTAPKPAEGILSYGNSYKMGMRAGKQVFTLFGIIDITNTVAPQVDAGRWVHLAAAWEPGVGVHFYVDGTEYFEPNTNTAARPVANNYLYLASEGLANNSVAGFDRMRIHKALLTADQIDSVAATPRPLNANTLVSYDFNEPALPATNAIAPVRPTMSSIDFVPAMTSPVWTNDTPSGLPGDFALGFYTEKPLVYESGVALYDATPIDLGANNTNYTLQAWVKLPTTPLEERRVIYRTDGPGPRVALSINSTRTLHTTVLGTADFTTTVAVPNDNRWHHIGVVMEDFLRLRFYLDGVLRQTVNRTQTAAPSSGGVARIILGKESETRFFRGVLDRVIINNDALTNSTLDYPAIPGLATFATLASHPADVITNAGVTVTFTATPTSTTAATYQWHYRTNLADHVSIPVPGQTTPTLTLANVGATNEGFYSLFITNAAGATESYAARLTLRSSLELVTGFEAPKYKSGPLEEQDYWTTDQNGNTIRVLTAAEIQAALTAGGRAAGQTVHQGDRALLLNGDGIAATSVRQVLGFENQSNVTVSVWVRALEAGTVGTGIGNTFFTLENAAGVRAAGFRLGTALSIDYGSTNSGVWVATGLTASPGTWYKFTMRLNYQTRTYDFLVDDVKVNGSPIPFYTGTSDKLRQLRIFRGASQAGMIVDDLNIAAPATGPNITGVSVSGGVVTINWQGGQPPYQLQRRANAAAGVWEDVGLPTNGTQATDTFSPNGGYYRVGSN